MYTRSLVGTGSTPPQQEPTCSNAGLGKGAGPGKARARGSGLVCRHSGGRHKVYRQEGKGNRRARKVCPGTRHGHGHPACYWAGRQGQGKGQAGIYTRHRQAGKGWQGNHKGQAGSGAGKAAGGKPRQGQKGRR